MKLLMQTTVKIVAFSFCVCKVPTELYMKFKRGTSGKSGTTIDAMNVGPLAWEESSSPKHSPIVSRCKRPDGAIVN